MPKFAVILSGCGVNDGSEIHEAVVTLLSLARNGADYDCFAPNKPQMHVIDHVAGQPNEGEARNCMVESARISRGEIKDLAEYKAAEYDGLILPGGFGAAKNLCTYATQGAGCTVDEHVKKAVLDTHKAGKTIGAMCIAPAAVAKAFEGSGITVTMTIGNDATTAADLEKMGAKHKNSPVDTAIVDEDNKIVSAPAYMLAGNIAEAAAGIEDLVAKVVKLAKLQTA